MNSLSRDEVAGILERFLAGTSGDWEWDDFLSSPVKDPVLNEIRLRCSKLDSEFPPEKAGEFCNSRGRELIRDYAVRLRAAGDKTP